MDRRKAWGGTLALWRREIDPFITPLETPSPSVLPLLLQIPGLSSSIHIGLYLPTWGRDSEFIEALASLESIVLFAIENFKDMPIYLKGDCNVNSSNVKRAKLFHNFLTKYGIQNIDLQHKTHQHFMRDGKSDFQLD